MTCFYCKGDMEEGFTTHVAEFEHGIVIIKNVPCLKCKQCGEVIYSGEIMQQLDQILDKMETSMTEVAIVNFSDKVA